MKNTKKVMLAAVGALLTGFGSVALSMKSNETNNDTVLTNTNNVSLVSNTGYSLAANAAPAPAAKESSSSGLDIPSMIIDGIQKGGANFVGSVVSGLANSAFNAVLKEMGFDTRSVTEKQFDKLEGQIDTLQKSLEKGISDIQREMVEINNKNIMSEVLGKVKGVQTPVASKMAVLADISKKELEKHDEKELNGEKETFLKSLGALKFDKLSENNLWNATETLANAIIVPFQANPKLSIFDLYEDTYGALETWDYMTIKPRTQFIAYLGFTVNSLCQLAKLEASYQMSQLKAGDSNLKDYEKGVEAMVKAVNSLNECLKGELDKLSAIKKQHDEQGIITHRDRIVDKSGNVTIKNGISVSTRLMPVTTSDSEYNYISYKSDKNTAHVVRDWNSGQDIIWENNIYTLDCSAQADLYKTVINEYKDYNKALGKTNYSDFTVKDYLLAAGFICKEKDLFDKAKGFYKCINCNSYNGGRDNLWSTERKNDLNVTFYDFSKAEDEAKSKVTYDRVTYYKDGWFSDGRFTNDKQDAMNNYYLCFLGTDQKTLLGSLTKTTIEKVTNQNTKGTNWNSHFKGHRTYKEGQDKAVIDC